ncbi:MAG: carboxypeptidase regulatory-like domain-containing protein [Planctomycetes bacterium]|nr:carboxypeptidase regulatory-like domain-containing protein [Planctomycetota bacterium]
MILIFGLLVCLGLGGDATVADSTLSISGRVFDTQGNPVPAAIVIGVPEFIAEDAPIERRLAALVRLQDVRSLPAVQAVADQRGAFTLATGTEVSYRLIALAESLAPTVVRFADNPSSGLRIEMAEGVPTMGRVVSTDGSPIAGARVAARFASGGSRLEEVDILETIIAGLLPPIWVGTSDEAGRFQCPFGDGSVRLSIRAGASGHREATVELAAGGEVTITLEPGVRWSGRVLGAEGKPVEGALVRLSVFTPAPQRIHDPQWEVQTDANGAFEFDGLAPGDHRIVISHPGYAAYRHPRIRPDVAPSVFRLSRGRPLAIQVQDGTGAPVPDAWVELTEEREVVHTARTSTEGWANFSTVATVGQPALEVVAKASGFVDSRPLRWDYDPGRPAKTVVLHTAVPVAGVITDEEGSPLAGAVVFLQQQIGGLESPVAGTSSCRTGSSGEFRFTGAEPGQRYTLRASKPGFLESACPVFDVTFPGVTDVRLSLERPLALRGIVVDPSGSPIAGASVGIRDSLLADSVERLRRRSETRADGRFEIPGLRPGRVQLLVDAPGYRYRDDLVSMLDRSRPSDPVRCVLEPSVQLRGRVIDLAGAPLADVAVTILDTSEGLRRISVTTDREGRFVADDLGGQPVTVKAEKPGHGSVRLEEVEPGVVEIELQLGRG